ncbi:MAG: hypothetical protein V1667_00650 [bacterium]
MSLKGILGLIVGHEVIDHIMKGLGAVIREEGVKTLKANIFGMGTTDEVLTGDAFAIAVKELGVTHEEVIKVTRVLSEFSLAEKNKLTNIFGRDEQEIIQKTPTIKNGKTVIIETKTVANMRGARLILLLSKMREDDIRTFLKGIDATTTASDRLKESLRFIKTGLDNLDQSEWKTRAETYRDEWKAKYLIRKQGRR